MTAPFFGGHWFDRLDAARGDPDALAALAARSDARVLDMATGEVRVGEDGRLVRRRMAKGEPLLLLGLVGGGPLFATLGAPPPARPDFALLAQLGREEAPLYAAARSLADWHARHPFCAACGAPTEIFRAGWGRRCERCAAEHFARVDPVVIMLAEHRGDVLLGRQPRYPPGRYSALAGFVEPGESIEDAVARELFEEAGVRACSVRYVASQPWPFPYSLMIGCLAGVEDRELVIDYAELDDARWFSRDAVASALAGDPGAPFIAPPRFAIASDLLEAWLAGHRDAS